MEASPINTSEEHLTSNFDVSQQNNDCSTISNEDGDVRKDCTKETDNISEIDSVVAETFAVDVNKKDSLSDENDISLDKNLKSVDSTIISSSLAGKSEAISSNANTDDIVDYHNSNITDKIELASNIETKYVNNLAKINDYFQGLKDKSDDLIFIENEENETTVTDIVLPKNITSRKRKISDVGSAISSSPKLQKYEETINLDSPNVSSTTEDPIQIKTNDEINDSIIFKNSSLSKTETTTVDVDFVVSNSSCVVSNKKNKNVANSSDTCNILIETVQSGTHDTIQDSIVLDSPQIFNTAETLVQKCLSGDKMEISDTDSANTTCNSTDADVGNIDTSIYELDDYATKTSLDLITNVNSHTRDSVLFVDEIKPKIDGTQRSANTHLCNLKDLPNLNEKSGILCDKSVPVKLKTALPSPKHLVVLSDSEGDNTPDQTLKNEALVPELGQEEIHDLTECDLPFFDLLYRLDENSGLLSLVITRKQLDYNADVSRNGSPSSVTSGGLYALLDKRYSSVSSSTTSSGTTTSSTRTTDGSFIIPHPPGSKITHKKHTLKGHAALHEMVDDIFQNIRKTPGIDGYTNSVNTTENNNTNNNSNNGKVTSINTPKSSRELRKRNLTVKRADTPTILDRKYKTINSPEMTSRDTSKFNRDEHALSIYDDISEENNKTVIKNKQIKKFTGRWADSPKSSTYSPTSKSIATIREEGDEAIGQRVLARWIDKKYYSGRIKEIKDFNKFVVEFDDNKTKALPIENIIFGRNEQLPLCGQSVYAILENEDYEPGIVSEINADESGKIFYSVMFDRGLTLAVEAGDICLTDDQAKALKDQNPTSEEVGPSTPRRRTNPNVDMDNIITGPRNRKTGIQKAETPKPGSSGLGKKRGPKSKARHISESSDQSVTEPPSPAEADDRSPHFIEEVQGVEPELQKTPKKIQGALTGPFPVKGCGRLSGRRSSKVVGTICDNTDPETVELLGPIPSAANFFKNIIFLLTCTEPPKKKITDGTNTGTDSEIAGDTDCEDREFIPFPFVKERLRSQIEAAGGVVYSHFEDVPNKKYKSCKLIAPRPCHTAKYIQCLASNIPAKTHGWIIRCCKANRLMKDSNDDLPAGWSIEKKCFIEWTHNKNFRCRKSPSPFSNYLIILCSDNRNFIEFWGRVCKLAGASVRNVDENLDLTGASAIVTDFDCPIRVTKLAHSEDIPLVSTMWIVQTLIVGEVCEQVNNAKYHYNYPTDTD